MRHLDCLYGQARVPQLISPSLMPFLPHGIFAPHPGRRCGALFCARGYLDRGSLRGLAHTNRPAFWNSWPLCDRHSQSFLTHVRGTP